MPTRVLVLEDDPISRLFLVRNIEEDPDFEVTAVSRGEAAIEAADSRHFDILLADIYRDLSYRSERPGDPGTRADRGTAGDIQQTYRRQADSRDDATGLTRKIRRKPPRATRTSRSARQ